jgi:queuine tRNA-ribosyltransferase
MNMLPFRKIMSFSTSHRHSFSQMAGSDLKLFDSHVMQGQWLESEKTFLMNKGLISDADNLLFSEVGPRRGQMSFGDVVVETPTFMPVGTAGAVKSLEAADVSSIGFSLILGNTYHLYLRPGLEVLNKFAGLHGFMRWPGVLLTDSGGFQVMSLAKIRKLTEEGVTFANHINGSRINLTPESVVGIQDAIDSDIQMVLDECTPYPAEHDVARLSMERSMRWAKRARAARSEKTRAQFGIVQGGMHTDLRALSARQLVEIGFEGYAVGGLSVGEPKPELRRVLAGTTAFLPHDKPRYLMGVGTPDDLFDGVLMGIDMFDCVLPTRNARNGSVFVRTDVDPSGKIQIKNAVHRLGDSPLDPSCSCSTCRTYSRSYLRHLFVAQELTVYRLLTIHSLQFLHDFMRDLRTALECEFPAQSLLEVRNRYVGQPTR